MNKKAIKITLRGLLPKGYTACLFKSPSLGLNPTAFKKLYFRDHNGAELWPGDRLTTGETRGLFAFVRLLTSCEAPWTLNAGETVNKQTNVDMFA